jgi:hypothetical protein
VRVEVPIGNLGRVIFNRGTKGGVVLESKPGRGAVRAKFSKRESSLDEMNTLAVTTLKGNSAIIYIGQQVPFMTTENFRARNTISQAQSTNFRDVRTGFKILPQFGKDQVILEIAPHQSRIIKGNIEKTDLNTIIRGQVGEWIKLGGLSQSSDENKFLKLPVEIRPSR